VPKVLIGGVPTDVSLDQIFADDGTTPFSQSLSQQAVQGRTFTEDDVARIRQEEKDKVYGRLEETKSELTTLREQIGSLTAAEQRRAAELEAEQQRLAEEARRQEEEGLDARTLIQRKEQEWQEMLRNTEQGLTARLEEEKRQREAAEAAAAKEREFGALRDYTLQQVAAHENDIAPQLRPWIQGNTKEEIDAAIARAVDTTNAITAEMQGVLAQQQNQEQQFAPGGVVQPPALPGTRATAPAGMDPATFSQTLTKEQIDAMPMDQYAKLRSQLGIGGQGNNRGLFG
jgi:hypothetical protein